MKKSWVVLLASVAGLFLSGTVTRANDLAPEEHVAAVEHPLVNDELSSQRGRGFGGGNRGGGMRAGGGNRGGGMRGGGMRGGNVGRIGNVNRGGRIGGNYGRGGRVGWNYGRVGRVGWNYGRYGRYGRVGRIGYRPWPVPVPGPAYVPGPALAPGPGIMAPAVAAPTCPVCPVQQCVVAIYSDQNLQGTNVETRDNQPRLDASGWQNQISSIIVKGGTWEFFPEPEYRGGQPLRLAPGSYPMLEQQWTKSIGSFMCVR